MLLPRPPAPSPKPFRECEPPFSVRQLAKHWGCGECGVRKLISSGELASFRIGVLIRITAAEVKRFEAAAVHAPSNSREPRPARAIDRKPRARPPFRRTPSAPAGG